MDDNLRSFLEKFAELERRVRKQAAEDRALHQEVRILRERLLAAESEAALFREVLEKERGLRHKARDRVSDLIERIEGLRSGSNSDAAAIRSVQAGEETAEVEDGE